MHLWEVSLQTLRCLLGFGVEPAGHKDRPSPSLRRCLNSPSTWLPTGLPKNVRGALEVASAMSQQFTQVTLCWKGRMSCLPAMGHGVQLDWRGTSLHERKQLPSQGFPALGTAPSTRPVSQTSPKPRLLGLALAMGDADPGPGMGQDTCPTLGFCCGL